MRKYAITTSANVKREYRGHTMAKEEINDKYTPIDRSIRDFPVSDKEEELAVLPLEFSKGYSGFQLRAAVDSFNEFVDEACIIRCAKISPRLRHCLRVETPAYNDCAPRAALMPAPRLSKLRYCQAR